MFCIFDLDGTVICSKHRHATLSDGSLDLEHWIENSTPDKIAQDSVLPLVSLMRKNWRGGHTVIICTARVLADADYAFFMENDIPFHTVLSRPEGCTMADTELKDIQLRLYAQNKGVSWKRFSANAVIYDDNQAVLKRCKDIGIRTQDAVVLNRILAA